jgi:ribosomal protein S18 acetylase RimI-like enzyme
MDRIERTKNGEAWMYFAKDSETGELVGMIGGYRDEENRANHSAQIWGMYVRPEYRGKGIAKDLMERLVDEMQKNRDISKAVLEVNVEQQPAKMFYENFGFKATNTFTCALGDGEKHEVSIMEKELVDI